jgi:hypothetical protein
MQSAEDGLALSAGRALAQLRRTVRGVCAWPPCGEEFTGRPGKKYHAKKCKMAASRARRRLEGLEGLGIVCRPRDVEQCADEVAKRLERCMEEATERMKRCGRQAIEDFRRCVQESAQAASIATPGLVSV